jgi:hypothetical protein
MISASSTTTQDGWHIGIERLRACPRSTQGREPQGHCPFPYLRTPLTGSGHTRRTGDRKETRGEFRHRPRRQMRPITAGCSSVLACSSAGLSILKPAKVAPVQPRPSGAAQERGSATPATARPGCGIRRPQRGPRLPQPDLARSRGFRVEPPRRPAFPLIISNSADTERDHPDDIRPHD